MKIQGVNKYYDFVSAKKFCKETALHHKQEYNIAQDKMQKSLKSVPDLDECEERKRNKDLNVGF